MTRASRKLQVPFDVIRHSSAPITEGMTWDEFLKQRQEAIDAELQQLFDVMNRELYEGTA